MPLISQGRILYLKDVQLKSKALLRISKHQLNLIQLHNSYQKSSETTSGRSEVVGRSPSDLADLTELKIFSPTLDKSIPPPCSNKKGTKKRNLEVSNPSLKSPSNAKGFPRALPNGNRFGCISHQVNKFNLPCAAHLMR